jgi:hypothetical protein
MHGGSSDWMTGPPAWEAFLETDPGVPFALRANSTLGYFRLSLSGLATLFRLTAILQSSGVQQWAGGSQLRAAPVTFLL